MIKETGEERYERIMEELGEYWEMDEKYGYDWERQFGPIQLPEYEDEIMADPNYSLARLLREHKELK